MIVGTTGVDEYPTHLRMLVAGHSGSGKTRLAAGFPNPIFADARAGLMSVADRGVPFVRLTCAADLLELRLALDCSPEERREKFGHDVDTLVLDTLDEFQRVLLAERLLSEKRSETTISDYGWLGQRMHTIFEGLMSLPLHVVVNCHLKDITEGEGQLFVKPGLVGAFTDQVHQYMDFSLLLQSRHWGSPPELVEELGGDDPVVEFPEDNTQLTYLRTYQDGVYEWVKDYSGTLPPEFVVNFTDDFTRLYELVTQKRLTLSPSGTKTIVTDEGEVPHRTGTTAHQIKETKVKAQKLKIDKSGPRVLTAEFEGGVTDTPCTDCEKLVENQDRLDLSKIRYRVPLCTECFTKRLNASA